MMTPNIMDGANPLAGTNSPQPGASKAAPYKDATTASFKDDVIDMSANGPVLVDFWAPWCGPCRQLGPTLEKVVGETAGRVKLVKVNIDENQALAGQMGVRSIPAVFAFSGGQPVDGFMGALPESELRNFVKKLLEKVPSSAGQGDMNAQIEQVFEAGEKALELNDVSQAVELYGLVLNQMPEHTGALLGLVNAFIKSETLEQAQQTLDLVPEADRKTEAYLAAKTALGLAQQAGDLDDLGEIRARLEADANDHQARMDMAIQLNATGNRDEAAQALIEIIRRDRQWNEDAARTRLLELFEAWGAGDPASIAGRKALSRVLFS